jgi:hypothetical protein
VKERDLPEEGFEYKPIATTGPAGETILELPLYQPEIDPAQPPEEAPPCCMEWQMVDMISCLFWALVFTDEHHARGYCSHTHHDEQDAIPQNIVILSPWMPDQMPRYLIQTHETKGYIVLKRRKIEPFICAWYVSAGRLVYRLPVTDQHAGETAH